MGANKQRKNTLYIVHAAIIAALYVVLTVLSASFDLASGAIQVRISECLTVLPFFTVAGIPGVTIGCFLANVITGCMPLDVLFGTLATLLGAIGTYLLRERRLLCTLPPVIANVLIVPFVLKYVYGADGAIPFFMLTVGAGEIITCIIFGQILISILLPLRGKIFGDGVEAVKKRKRSRL